MPRRVEYQILCAVNLAILLGLIVYSVTWAFVWDESFHVLAAQLIRIGKKPYIDFCFPQAPLNAYLNAGIIAAFGNHWQPIHAVAAILTACSIFLAADFVYRENPSPEWKLPTAIFASLSLVSLYTLLRFATVGQANAVCLAFAVAAVRRAKPLYVFAAGVCVGIAAASSLLVAAALPVLWVWIVLNARGIRNAALFIAGAAIPFAPVVWLFVLAPRQTFFNLIAYQAIYRRLNWGAATAHDLEVVLGLGQSPAALILVALALAGVFILKKAEVRLAFATAAAIGLECLAAHPTFERYFILTAPFLAIPAAAGFQALGAKLARRPWAPLTVVAFVFALSMASQLFEDRDLIHWRDIEEVAEKVSEVTRPGGTVYADEMVYFLTGLPVPEGIQFSYNHRMSLPAADEALYHVISQQELEAQVRAGKFVTVETCTEGEADHLHLDQLYTHRADFDDCSVFWGAAKQPGR